MQTEVSTKIPILDSQGGRAAFLVGAVSAILASTCCIGPLILITLGVSGAWIANLAALEPYRPALIVAALAALLVAGRRIWAPIAVCTPGTVCAVPKTNRRYKVLFGVVSALVLVAMAFPYIAPLFY